MLGSMAKTPVAKDKKPNAEDRRQRKATEVQHFVQATGRKKRHGLDPNDRHVDRRMTDAVRHMAADQFYQLLRDGED